MNISASPVRPLNARQQTALRLAKTGVVAKVPARHIGARARDVECIYPRSRATNPWWERIDPFWNPRLFSAKRAWTSGADPDATSKSPLAVQDVFYGNQREAIYQRKYVPNMNELMVAASQLTDNESLRIVSVLRGAGRCLSGQLAAFAGINETVFNTQLTAARNLIETEVIEFSWHHQPAIPYPRAVVYQLRGQDAYLAWARQIINMGIAHNVFCVTPPALDQQSRQLRNTSRHHILCLELILRALELNETWVGWLPETSCHAKHFRNPQLQERKAINVVSDGCLIRNDGMRLFIEIEATPASSTGVGRDALSDKIRNWIQLISEGSVKGCVLFVAASSDIQHPTQIVKRVEQLATPRTRPYLLVGSWRDYSPDYGLLSEDAATLRAVRYNGAGWEETHADTIDVPKIDAGIEQRIKDLLFIPPWITETPKPVDEHND